MTSMYRERRGQLSHLRGKEGVTKLTNRHRKRRSREREECVGRREKRWVPQEQGGTGIRGCVGQSRMVWSSSVYGLSLSPSLKGHVN
ncbi:hypothetical protein ACOSQ4_024540 [Xanthoceras sorbifolium]